MVITREQRVLSTLKDTVRKIYRVFQETQDAVCAKYPQLQRFLSPDITFITTQELEIRYPHLSHKERENTFTRDHGSMCLMQIGGLLKSGKIHDGRAPDYDDWSLNCDIVFHFPVLDCAFEVSSMGIRVDAAAMKSQLELAGEESRRHLPFHKAVLEDQLPLTLGGWPRSIPHLHVPAWEGACRRSPDLHLAGTHGKGLQEGRDRAALKIRDFAIHPSIHDGIGTEHGV